MGTAISETKSLGEAVGQLLATARSLKRISPEAAAEAAGCVSASYIRRIEKGLNSPSVEIIDALCRVYGTTLAKFFTALERTA